MAHEITYIYTDASYSKLHDIAVIGFAQFAGEVQHQLVPLSELELKLEVIPEKNNIRAEIRGAISALRACNENLKIVLYSDCHAVVSLPQRREKLEKQKFISQSSGLKLRNADLYKEFYLITDQLNVEFHWVKGHSSNKKSDQIQANFSYLDRQVRKKLRDEVERLTSELKSKK